MIARIGGRNVSYEISDPDSSGRAPVIVFVHGLGASAGVWKGQAERLGGRYRVLRYDLRSHGESDPVDAPCTRGDLAADLVDLLDHLSIDRAVIAGHSGGGVVAMQTAADRPERVAGLVLVGTASECNDKTAKWYADTAETARREGGEAAMRAMGLKPGSGPVPDGATLGNVVMAMRTLNADPLTDRMRSVAVPTLIIVGEKDFLGAGGSVILSRVIEGSELEIVEGRGHGIYLEDPDWFAGRLAAFVDSRIQST